MPILTLVLMAANVLALAAKPSSASTPYDVMELTVLFVVLAAGEFTAILIVGLVLYVLGELRRIRQSRAADRPAVD
jgi:hypothetical protein